MRIIYIVLWLFLNDLSLLYFPFVVNIFLMDFYITKYLTEVNFSTALLVLLVVYFSLHGEAASISNWFEILAVT